ncbi:MAG TPA: antibiotic biosynthesis monooxygenase family protein [Acidimicrobiia bacterium]|nr:antibiotic biosynthesis monooxygenase family protein [Acidimicrobiia bacterium]
MGFAYIWEYEVDPAHLGVFEQLYGPSGEWVELFRLSPGYRRTELHRDRDNPYRYVTIDYWESARAWQEWRAMVQGRFEELDRRGQELTSSERELGRFDLREND